jgi:hypothetical protein
LICEPTNEIVSGAEPPTATRGWPQVWGCRLLFCLPLLAAAPEAVRWLAAWPDNRAWFPNVIGPGDSATVTVSDRISSVNGLWSGESTAWIQAPAKLRDKLVRLHGRTNTDRWGSEFEGRWIGNRSARLWTQVRVPLETTLTGQTLHLRLVTNVRYPQEIAPNPNTRPGTVVARPQSRRAVPAAEDHGWYVTRRREYESLVRLRLAAPYAGTMYRGLWQFGQCAILAIAAIVGLIFVGLTRIAAEQRPTQVYLRPTSARTATKAPSRRTPRTRRLT